MPNLSFRGRRELSTGLHLQQKIKKKQMAITHCRQARNQEGLMRTTRAYAQILNPWEKIVMTAYSPLIIPPSCRSVDNWYFAEISALELTAEYCGLLRRVVLPHSDSMLCCAVSVGGVRCCGIALLGHNSLSYWSTLLFFRYDFSVFCPVIVLNSS